MQPIILDNKKLHDFIVEKDLLVEGGRKISRDIETKEIKIKRLEEKEKKITSKVVPPKELTDRGDVVTLEIVKLSEELDKIGKQIHDAKLLAVPNDIRDEHLLLMKEVEKLERDRNKVALKVQKVKDKLVPLAQSLIKPLLKNEFDDVETAKAKDGKVVVSTFNYVEDYKKKLRSR